MPANEHPVPVYHSVRWYFDIRFPAAVHCPTHHSCGHPGSQASCNGAIGSNPSSWYLTGYLINQLEKILVSFARWLYGLQFCVRFLFRCHKNNIMTYQDCFFLEEPIGAAPEHFHSGKDNAGIPSRSNNLFPYDIARLIQDTHHH